MSVRSLRYNELSLRLPKGTSALPIERDAWAFLEAAGITSALQQRAVVQLVRDLKKAQLWTKMKAIYPFVGDTASSHKWNLKDPRDLDAAFRLSFAGGWTHSANGADPNGVNAMADTYLVANTQLQLNSAHISIYIREDVDGLQFDMGAANSGIDYITLLSRWNNLHYGRIHSTSNTTQANTDSRGFYISNRTSSTQQKIYKNSNTPTTGNVNSTARPTQSIGLGAFNNVIGGAFYYSTRQIAFATIGDGLTDTEAANLYNAVQRYQQLLGRAV